LAVRLDEDLAFAGELVEFIQNNEMNLDLKTNIP
jgi:hypothetical protein